jgi:hypothetical protein
MSNQVLERARGELEAIAAMIERPPLGATSFDQDASVRLAKAIRMVLATPVTVTVEAVREACRQYAMDDLADQVIYLLCNLYLIGDGSGWARRVSEVEWEAQIGHPIEDTASYWTEKAKQAARSLGFIAPDPDPRADLIARHPGLTDEMIDAVVAKASALGEKL